MSLRNILTTYDQYPRRQFSGRQIREHPLDCSAFCQLVWIRPIAKKNNYTVLQF